jgi:hypothetical protein
VGVFNESDIIFLSSSPGLTVRAFVLLHGSWPVASATS